jgi:hypothetical protein
MAAAQVWALAVAPKDDQRVATGGGDSVVNLWEDRTEELAEADTRAEEARPPAGCASASEFVPLCCT